MNNLFNLISANSQNVSSLMGEPQTTVKNKATLRSNKLNQVSNKLSDVAIASGNPYAMAAGLGVKGMNMLNSMINNKGRDEYGIYKNKISMIGDLASTPTFMLPFKLAGLKKEQRQAKELKQLSENTNVLNTTKSALGQANSNKNRMFQMYQRGGKLNDCGCNKESDGIDTDDLFKLNQKQMDILNKILNLPLGTKYDNENVKPKIKEFAKSKNMRLVDFLHSNPEVKQALLNKEGGWLQKAINPEHKGYCTPMTKSTCTPRRKALARRFKSGDLSK